MLAEADALTLRCDGYSGYGAVRVDWSTADLRRRLAAGRRQPLARALGVRKSPPACHVVDATAGLGRDAWVLAALGARVTLLERAPAVAALLADALQRALHDEEQRTVAERIELHSIDARAWLARARPGVCDAIYLDPMYPEDGKTALPAKEMQFLRELTGGDPDAGELLALACSRARRVAVKRPLHAPPLAERRPDTVIHASRIRFDMYLNPGVPPCAS